MTSSRQESYVSHVILTGIGPTFLLPHLLKSAKLATAVWGPLLGTDVDHKPSALYNLGNISRLETATYFLLMLAFASLGPI